MYNVYVIAQMLPFYASTTLLLIYLSFCEIKPLYSYRFSSEGCLKNKDFSLAAGIFKFQLLSQDHLYSEVIVIR